MRYDTPVVLELRKGRIPRWRLRARLVRRVIGTGKEGIQAVILAIFSLIITVDLYFFPLYYRYLRQGQPDPLRIFNWPYFKVSALVLASIAICVFLVILCADWAIRAMTPAEYAQVLIAGRPMLESLQSISYEILAACRDFIRVIKPFQMNPNDLEYVTRETVRPLEAEFSAQQGRIVRISALLALAAKELNMPLARLRDRLFGYDPVMHRADMGKYLRNLQARALAMERKLEGFELPEEMLYNLKGENEGIYEIANKVMVAQEHLLRYTSLDRDVLHLAAVHSTSEALEQYARALSTVARRTLETLHNARGEPDQQYNQSNAWRVHDGVAAIRFLAQKQHSHSGFDLNELCKDLCSKLKPLNIIPVAELGRLQLIFTDLLGSRGHARGPGDEPSYWPFDNGAPNVEEGRYTEAVNKLRLLAKLWEGVTRLVWTSRVELSERFRSAYRSWSAVGALPPIDTLLVTHGFSGTVLHALKFSFSQTPAPRVFIIKPEEPEDKSDGRDDLDSRMMQAALVHTRQFRSVAVGDVHALIGVLNLHTKVLVVLGAECFDGSRHVLHPWGVDLETLIPGLTAATGTGNVKVFVVAEEYKCQADLQADLQLYRFHLDRVRLYKPDFIDAIITNERTIR